WKFKHCRFRLLLFIHPSSSRARPTLFPTRRSSDLKAPPAYSSLLHTSSSSTCWFMPEPSADQLPPSHLAILLTNGTAVVGRHWADRKSTRLNSSHVAISYVVFCL